MWKASIIISASIKNDAVKRKVKAINEFSWLVLKGRYEDRFFEETYWAEAAYVVSKGYKIRIMISRWRNPDPTPFDASPYCYHVIATNNWEIDPMDWLEVHNGWMGTIEHCHKELKAGLGCDYTPSHDFEKNRGYFLLSRAGVQHGPDPEVVLSWLRRR